MFMLYALVVGVVVGLAAGGRVERLGRLTFRWVPLAAVGILAQVLLFSTPAGAAMGGLAPILYVASTAAVLAFVVRNASIVGLPLVALGAASNLLAIVANGGYMPAGADALAALGRAPATGYSNSALVADASLRPLTDVFAMPGGIPFANVFSVGDVLIGVGIAVAVVAAMRRGAGVVLAGTSPEKVA